MKKAADTKGLRAKTKKAPTRKRKPADLEPTQRKTGEVKGGYIIFGGNRRK